MHIDLLFLLAQGYVEQESLVLSTNKGNARLKDLYMRPVIGSRRVQVWWGCGVVFDGDGVWWYSGNVGLNP